VRRGRAALWIPYLQSIEKVKTGWKITYNGGDFVADLNKVDSILLYGASGALPVSFLDELAAKRVPLLIHRRNLADPYVFVPGGRRDDADILSAQIKCRDNKSKSAYVARTLVRERFSNGLYPASGSFLQRIKRLRSVEEIRLEEAHQSRSYWQRFFTELELPEDSRRGKNPVAAALDAGSFFLYGVMLRWVLMHKLSPAHGFLHVTTGYPSLVYDLLEPYRYIIEIEVLKAPDLTAACLSGIKASMDTSVFVPSHRAHVRRKNLLHGAVLSLRSWLIGEAPRLVFPTEGAKIGGRPPAVSYRLPGAIGKLKTPLEGRLGAGDACSVRCGV
jgi:hypothetical protein